MDKDQITKRAYELENALHALRRTHFAKKDDSGLRFFEQKFLWLLSTLNNGGPVMPSEAAKKLGVTLSAITHRINSLEEQGYIVRSPSPDDRRVVFITLSDKGTEMLQATRKSYLEKMYGLVEYLGDKDSSALIALLTKISDYNKRTTDA